MQSLLYFKEQFEFSRSPKQKVIVQESLKELCQIINGGSKLLYFAQYLQCKSTKTLNS